jgi:hypothetical protein
LHATYRLHTVLLEYTLAEQHQKLRWVIDDERDENPTEERFEQAQQRAGKLRSLLGELYVLYHAYQRFAEAILGVDLETWLGAHSNGQPVREAVSATLDDSLSNDAVGKVLNPEIEPGDDD